MVFWFLLGGKGWTQNRTLDKVMAIYGTSAVASPKTGHPCSLFQKKKNHKSLK